MMMADVDLVTAVELATSAGVDPKSLRRRLRLAQFDWHRHGASWTVTRGSRQHDDMLAIIGALRGDPDQPDR